LSRFHSAWFIVRGSVKNGTALFPEKHNDKLDIDVDLLFPEGQDLTYGGKRLGYIEVGGGHSAKFVNEKQFKDFVSYVSKAPCYDFSFL
jgi:hypothetical protein